MVMSADEMWKLVNHKKYQCETCCYCTHNKNHFTRHCNSTRHWLLCDFAKTCPKDLKILIGSFLPMHHLTFCGHNGLLAMNVQAREFGIAKFVSLMKPSAGLHVRIGASGVRIERSSQNPSSG